MARKVMFVGLYVIIFMVSLLFGHTLKSYAAPATGNKEDITASKFMAGLGHDLETLGKDGIRTSVRSNNETVELRFHGCAGRDDYGLDAGDEYNLIVDGSMILVDLETETVTVYGIDRYSGEYVVYHAPMKEYFYM